MFKFAKRTLAAVAMLAAVSAPSSAYAMYEQNAAAAPAAGAVVQQPISQSAARPVAASPQGFQWDDAGIGAAGVIALVGAAGASSVLARRLRGHRTAAG